MANLTGNEIRTTYERLLQNQHGQIHDGLGQDVSASIHTLHVNNSFTVGGDVVISGSVTAQAYYTEFVSASTIYESGSTLFGDTPDDSHTFIGTVNITGNETLAGNLLHTGNTLQTGSLFTKGNISTNPGVFMNPNTFNSNVIVPENYNAGAYGPLSNAATIQIKNNSKLRIFP
jgi:hypothetical protein